jgi:hypothetical protein
LLGLGKEALILNHSQSMIVFLFFTVTSMPNPTGKNGTTVQECNITHCLYEFPPLTPQTGPPDHVLRDAFEQYVKENGGSGLDSEDQMSRLFLDHKYKIG